MNALGYEPADYDFFSIHIDGDDDHAETMRTIIRRELAEQPEKVDILTNAAHLAIRTRVQFFKAISNNKTTGKITREVSHVL